MLLHTSSWNMFNNLHLILIIALPVQ
ncbi:hypothetical protein LINGRAHAP2_LOCUS24092 [Linum grandiflorum]